MTRNSLVRLFAVVAIAASACSGDDGATGAQGPQGPAGADGADGTPGPAGQPGTSGGANGLSLKIDKVETVTVDGVATSTVTFTVYPASAVCPGGTCSDNLSVLPQKTFYATEYDAATRTFPTAKSFQFSGHKFVALVDDGKGAQYTAKNAKATFAPELSQSAMIYGYIADKLVLPAKGHYSLYDNVSSASKVYGTISYESASVVSGCEKCHDGPYSKHGYRQGAVAGLPDMASCKACHTDQRVGSHADWQLLVDDPLAYATLPATGMTQAQKDTYKYVASTMNDTHMSHAMEFAYPQSMGNCVTCHEGKLDMVLTDANFTLATCKSCHPVTGPVGGNAKRAPALKAVVTDAPYHPADLYAFAGACNACHKAQTAGGFAPTFAQIHSGYDKKIYAAEGEKFASKITTTIDSASYDAATNTLTATVSMTGLAANAVVKPTVVVSLYGYDTKDFVVSGHGSISAAQDAVCPNDGGQRGTTLLEYTYGAVQRTSATNPCSGQPSTSSRLTLDPAAPTAGATSWTVTANLSLWADRIPGQVKRVELAFLPAVGTDQATVYGATNAMIAASGASATISLAGTGSILTGEAAANGANIVSAAKCDACHDALGTTFHNPNYGSAGVVGCRVCHVAGTAGGHLEMQSRSIDSYVHAIHSFQPFDIGSVDFADPVEKLHTEHHIGSTYPNFSILNCESCHSPGMYEVPDQAKSLPGVLSGSATVADRAIAGVPSNIVGAASRACGSCHRAAMINADDAGGLAAFNAHTASFGTLVPATAGFDAVTAAIMSSIGGPTAPAVAGATVESCAVCHAGAGAHHQAAYNAYNDGL